MIDSDQAVRFLSNGRIAVVGASDNPRNFGRAVVQALLEHGIPVVAVHPDATTVAGAPCYSSVDALPSEIDGVIIMVNSAHSPMVAQECIQRGIQRVWLFKGIGRGAVSEDALAICREGEVEVIAGACPLMFLQPVRGAHRLHRALRRSTRSVSTTR
jgi:predicted CoA-binding protein